MIRKIAFCTAVLAIGVWAQTRPRDPFIFRAILRSAGTNGDPSVCQPSAECQNRLIAVLLDAQMTALYSTETGSLYLTRNALPQDGNLTYSHTQFGSRLAWQTGGTAGVTMHRNDAAKTWELMQAGAAVSSSVVYKGFNLTGNVAQLKHQLVAGASSIAILETPEYISVDGKPGLRRTIAVSGLGSGQSVRLLLSGSVKPETWTAQSGGTLEGTTPLYLSITANGTAIVTGSWQP